MRQAKASSIKFVVVGPVVLSSKSTTLQTALDALPKGAPVISINESMVGEPQYYTYQSVTSEALGSGAAVQTYVNSVVSGLGAGNIPVTVNITRNSDTDYDVTIVTGTRTTNPNNSYWAATIYYTIGASTDVQLVKVVEKNM